MKSLLITFILFFCAIASNAQIYTFNSQIYTQSFLFGGKDRWSQFNKIDTIAQGVFMADLNKKIIINKGKNIPTMPDVEITNIIRNEKDHEIILETKPIKDIGVLWAKYKLKFMDNNNELAYVQLLQKMTGRDSAKDTVVETYTNNAWALSFYRKNTRIKQNLTLSTDTYAKNQQIRAMVNVDYTEAINTIEMRDGYIYWTEGEGKNAINHHLIITKAWIQQLPGTEGLDIVCYDNANNTVQYDIGFINTDRKMDSKEPNSGKSLHIVVNKYEDKVNTGWILLK